MEISAIPTNGTTTAPQSVEAAAAPLISASAAVVLVSRMLAGLFIVVTNLATIAAFVQVEALRTLSNMLVISRTVTDLMVGLVLVVDIFYWVPAYAQSLQASQAWCVVKMSWINIACLASILKIVAIAADRYIYIVHPFFYQRSVTATKVGLLIALLWVAALVWGTVPLYHNRFSEVKICDAALIFSPVYIVYFLSALLIVCFTVTGVIYSLIFRLSISKFRQVAPTNPIPKREGRGHLKRQLVVVKQSLVVFIVFVVCWSPHYIAYLVNTIYPVPFPTRAIISTLALVNSGLNFFIYIIFNRDFRHRLLLWLSTVPCLAPCACVTRHVRRASTSTDLTSRTSGQAAIANAGSQSQARNVVSVS